eukprot:CAMPEP_0184999142 /NCGR_PEP_ID=MMETSP1098-20130426/64595_1 /TAXON_ID=89044 /ORGANISM="Spumella elongata, Strain CCAP 955/1" /LENGTH=1212 /DNA_ID=CAMNT_0027526103 /DNA_START=175 /DNA_END=3813 /DNA_ORIENTATION=-
MVESLLAQQGIFVNEKDMGWCTALIGAVEKSHTENVKLLLAHPSTNVNIKDEYGQSALMMASSQGNTEIVEWLLGHLGIDVNLRDESGLAALDWAANGHTSIVKMLLSHPCIDVNQQDEKGISAVVRATLFGHIEIVQMLLSHPGVDAKNAFSALLAASIRGRVEIGNILLGHPGIDVNMEDEKGYSALIVATWKGRVEMVKMLLGHPGIEVNMQDKNGNLALIVASDYGYTEIVKMLLGHPGIEVNLENKSGDSALILASNNGHTEIVKMLLDHPGIDVNLQNEDGHTAFTKASDEGHTEIADLLSTHISVKDTDIDDHVLTTPLDATNLTTEDPIDDASSTVTEPPVPKVNSTLPALPVSWLAVHLLESGMDEKLVLDCELKLIVTEGFVSEADFADLPPSDVDAVYLKEIGILGRGVQVKIMKLHRELYAKYTPPSPPSLPSPLTVLPAVITTPQRSPTEPTFTCGTIPIEDVHDLSNSCHGATSSRLLLRGHFVHTSAEFGGYKTTKYHCVIKCAGDAVASAADSDETKAIQREFSMYEQVKEMARLKGCAATGCVACYHMHPSDHYLVLEAFGQNIRCLLAPNFKLAPQLAEAIVTAVAALHSLGVVHCDIKPHNILFELDSSHTYIIKLCDLDGSHKIGEVCGAASLGTTQYESPEVFFASCAGEKVTAALSMDVFSLGLVLWQVLSRSPYSPMSFEQLHECYSDQNELFSHVALPEPTAMYQPLLYSTLVLQPPHRRVTADALFKNMRDMAVSKAHPGWHKARQENIYLKEKVSDKLDGLDKKLDTVLEMMQVRFDALGGEVVTMAQTLRREILLGHEEQTQTLTSMKEATQDALEQLSEAQDSATISSAEHTDQILSCIHNLQSRIGNNVAPGAGGGDASTREKEVEGLLRSVPEQLNAQFKSLSVEFQEHAKRQSMEAADSAHFRSETMEMNHALSVSLQEVLKGIVTVQTEVLQLKQGQERLGVQVGRVLRENNTIQTMLRTLIAGTHAIPTYAIILPVVAKTWIKKADPMRLVRNKYRLYFMCSYTHQIAPCGPKGEGYKITVTKQWVRDAAPVLMAALVVLKLALNAGGIPLPIPDLSSLLTSAALHVKFLDAALHLVQNPPDDHGASEFSLDKAIGALDSVCVEEVAKHCEVIQGRGNHGMSLEEGSLKAYATIQSILTTDSIDIALSSGLRQVTHPTSGKTAWVLDNDTVVQEFTASL